MKARSFSILLAALLLILGSRPAFADSEARFENNGAVAADALIGRPLCLAVTFIGAGLFIGTLPFAIVSRSVNKSANALVVYPARLTFVRKLGDFSGME